MFTEINDVPGGTVGVRASGRITAADRKALEPALDTARQNGGIRLLYVTDPDFRGYEDGAPFDDAVFGTRRFTAFSKIAFVADDGPYDRAVHALEGLMPAALRTFSRSEIAKAKSWLAE